MTYRIEVKPQAEKALLRIPNPHRRRIAKAIDGLAQTPVYIIRVAHRKEVYRGL